MDWLNTEAVTVSEFIARVPGLKRNRRNCHKSWHSSYTDVTCIANMMLLNTIRVLNDITFTMTECQWSVVTDINIPVGDVQCVFYLFSSWINVRIEVMHSWCKDSTAGKHHQCFEKKSETYSFRSAYTKWWITPLRMMVGSALIRWQNQLKHWRHK